MYFVDSRRINRLYNLGNRRLAIRNRGVVCLFEIGPRGKILRDVLAQILAFAIERLKGLMNALKIEIG